MLELNSKAIKNRNFYFDEKDPNCQIRNLYLNGRLLVGTPWLFKKQ